MSVSSVVTSLAAGTREGMPALTPRRDGYVLDGEATVGFADRPELTEEQRRRIAAWAARFDPDGLQEVQAAPLDGASAADAADLAARGLIDDRAELQQLHLAGLLDELDDDQQRWLAHPDTHPDLGGAAYPLSVGELAALTGSSDDQVRRWADAGVLPTIRWSDDRRFGRGAAARAILVASVSKPEKAVLCAAARGDARRTVLLLGALLEDALARAGDELERGKLAAQLRAAVDRSVPAPPKRRAPAAKAESTRGRRKPVKHGRRIVEVKGRRGAGWIAVVAGGGTIAEKPRQKDALQAAHQYLKDAGGGEIVLHRGTADRWIHVEPSSARRTERADTQLVT